MSASKKRQTMAKHQRERAVKEKRALKLERKREAAELRLAEANGTAAPPTDESGEQVVSDDSDPSTTESPAQEEQLLA